MALTTEVSQVQRLWLERLRDGPPSPPYKLDVLARVIREMDRNGETNIHHDFVGAYESVLTELPQAVLGSPEYTRVVEFFRALDPLDSKLGAIDPRKLKLTFLLGAGASAPEPSSIPTVRFLLPQLLERARRLGREDLTKPAEFCEARKLTNIEDLLTAAQIASFCSGNSNVLELFNMLLYSREAGTNERDWSRRRALADTASIAFLQDTFQLLFGLLSNLMLPARQNAAHEAIVNHTRSHPNTTVVTTNYDCGIRRRYEIGQTSWQVELVLLRNLSEHARRRLRQESKVVSRQRDTVSGNCRLCRVRGAATRAIGAATFYEV